MLQSYRSSGRCGSTFYLATLGLVVFAAAAGWVYQRVVDVVPFIYVRFLVTGGFAWLLIIVLGKAQAYGRCRNAVAALVAGLLVASAGLAASHVAAFKLWQGQVSGAYEELAREEMREAGVPEEDRPGILAEVRTDVLAQQGPSEYLEDRLEYGWIFGGRAAADAPGGGLKLAGVAVWLIWLVEAIILLGAGVKGATAMEGGAYCEDCDQWIETVHDQILAANPKRKDIVAIRNAETAAALFPVGETRFGNAHSHLVHLWKECDGCKQGFLDVAVLTHAQNDKGEVSTETEMIRSNLFLDPDVREAFEGAAAAAKEAEKAALTPPEPKADEPR